MERLRRDLATADIKSSDMVLSNEGRNRGATVPTGRYRTPQIHTVRVADPVNFAPDPTE